jgi:hypothetical protein
MSEFAKAWLILITLTALVVVPYVFAWRGKRSVVRSSGAWTLSLVSELAAVVATSYAVGGLDDFHNPNLSFLMALFSNLITFAICICAWVMAIRFAILGMRKGPSRER